MKFTILSPYGLTRDTNMKKGQTFKNPLHYPHTLGKKYIHGYDDVDVTKLLFHGLWAGVQALGWA